MLTSDGVSEGRCGQGCGLVALMQVQHHEALGPIPSKHTKRREGLGNEGGPVSQFHEEG